MRVQSNTGVERYVDGVTLAAVPSLGKASSGAVESSTRSSITGAAADAATADASIVDQRVVFDGGTHGAANFSVGERHHGRRTTQHYDTDVDHGHQHGSNDDGDTNEDEVKKDDDDDDYREERVCAKKQRSARHSSIQHCSNRARAFASWLLSPAFGLPELLGEDACVLDVAGGKGELSLTLTMMGARSVLVDPREGKLSRRQRKALRRSDRVPFETVHTMFGGTAPEDEKRECTSMNVFIMHA